MRNRINVGRVGLALAAGVIWGQISPAAQTVSVAQAAVTQTTPAQAVAPTASAAVPAHLTFEVASVRPSPPLDMQKLQADMQAGKMPNFGMHIHGLRAEYNYLTLKDLIALAYKLKASVQVTGPAWLGTEHFNIVATMPEGSKKDDAPAMLQALLAERFKLVAHHETQEHPVLALVVGKGGPKMKESPGDAPAIDPELPLKPGEMELDTPDGPARMTVDAKKGGATINMGTKGVITYSVDTQSMMMHMTSSKTTMAALADTLTQMMAQMGGGSARQVLDMTNLKGNYEASLEFSLADMVAAARAQGMDVPGGGGAAAGTSVASDPGGAGSTVFASVEKLGLKLDQRKAPVEQIVVDSIEKTPTEN